MKEMKPEHKSTEQVFKEGLKFLNSLDYNSAESCFRVAYDSDPTSPKHLSYYGLSIAYNEGNPQVGLELCSRAIKVDSMNPDFFYNLGCVYKKMKIRNKAIQTLKMGLKLDRSNQKIIDEMNNIGLRTAPAISFLSRNSFLNIYFGKLKSFLSEL